MTTKKSQEKPKKTRVSQADLPTLPLQQALRVPKAIIDNYACEPTEPFDVAQAMGLEPNSSRFRMLTGASIAYGLTEGGAWASTISVTPLAQRILESDDSSALLAEREAFLKPEFIKSFLEKYDKKTLPTDDAIAQSILEKMGVPSDRTKDALEFILSECERLSLVQEIKGKKYVKLSHNPFQQNNEGSENLDKDQNDIDFPTLNDEPSDVATVSREENHSKHAQLPTSVTTTQDDERKRRVFITHGKNTNFLKLIKDLLQYGELEPVVSVDNQSVSEPVPYKVMKDMRSCGAAIIHVDAEKTLIDKEANSHVILNQNVLIEIGAAMALYGQRFILLVEENVKMPSNLQGLYEVRYSGDNLDGNTTINLLKAITELKSREFID